ncbi:helix-turn-helix transcriptional regulator [Echinimonas agarilytica]|uniref:YafY family transcriptional regulator n=1 Tax=Echinimonas agarilytica TaxID=1215918 RepID=A0AA41W7L2_9GAMM|nr:YafY family protein [Echinimonas agarilytica]MCM2680191.1 YafY family transcriptional regulator [Echinimonas agarilytica]
MIKSERLLQLLTLLRAKRTAITATQLAERLEVSERTIYRDIKSLIASGIDVDGEAGVGYMLASKSSVPPLMFSEQELESLMLGMRLVKALSDDALAHSAQTALDKIKAVLPERSALAHEQKTTKFVVPDFGHSKRAQYSELIRQAIEQKCCLSMTYIDAKERRSTRNVAPLGLLFWGATWTLVAWCELRNDYRMFRLDRIELAQLTDVPFEVTEERNFQHYLRQWDESASTDFW